MAKNRGEVKIRRMTRDDLMRVNQIDRLLSGNFRVPTWPFSFETYWDIYGQGASFVAEVDGQVVGFIAGNISTLERSNSILDLMHTRAHSSRYPKAGWIDMLGVHPDFQKKHVGQALVNAFYEECKNNGAPMRAIVKEGDDRLTAFLVRLGFKKWELMTYEKE